MGPIYNVVFNSANGSGLNNAKSYYFDWGQFPEGKYKCTFSYSGGVQTLFNISQCKVYLDLGQTKQYEAQSSFQSSTGTIGRYIGCLESKLAIESSTAIGNGTITGTVLTINALQAGVFNARQYISSDTGTITAGTYITSLPAGTVGGTGTYNLNLSSTVATPAQIYATNLPYYALTADTTANPPFYLDSKPDNSTITCNLLNQNGGAWLDSTGANASAYILTLSMELLD